MTKVFIIAEAGVNHNGSLERAFDMIDAAKNAGADAVKFQSFNASKLVTKTTDQASYQTKNTGKIQSQYDLLQALELSPKQFKDLKEYAKTKNILFLSTPFDNDYLNYLVDDLDMPLIKIPSGEVTNAPFLLDIARKGRDVILSTGMCTLQDIYMALSVLAFGFLSQKDPLGLHDFENAYKSEEGQRILKEKVTVLHCTTDYPTPYSDVHLNVLHTLKKEFPSLKIGYSDHTLDIFVPIAAVALGASIIEKHFTLDKTLEGPDHKASLDSNELKRMCEGIRMIEKSLGGYEKKPTPAEVMNSKVARKSIVAADNIEKGTMFTHNNLTFKRPGSGISPLYYWDLLGKKSEKTYCLDDLIVPLTADITQ